MATLVLFVVYGFHPVTRWKYRAIPGPSPTWLLGNLAGVHKHGLEGFEALCGAEHGPVSRIFLGACPVVVINDAALGRKLQMMSVSHMPRDKQGRSLARMEMGEEEEFSRRCIIFTDGQPWKEMRNAWMPWFTQPNIERFAGLMLHSADKFALRLGAAADAGMPIEIWAELGRMTLDVSARLHLNDRLQHLPAACGAMRAGGLSPRAGHAMAQTGPATAAAIKRLAPAAPCSPNVCPGGRDGGVWHRPWHSVR